MHPPAARRMPDHKMLLYVLAIASPAIAAPVSLLPAPFVDVPTIVRVVYLFSGVPAPVLFVLVLAILVWLALRTRAKQTNTKN
eukprot:6706956-Ditylum_brightwellii.AAC.1